MLFNPGDLMDVLETVKCLHDVAQLAILPIFEFVTKFRADVTNKPTIRSLHLLGHVSKLMCTLIIRHKGNIEDKGDHLSVSSYLTVYSTLAHMLFFLFRKYKTDFILAQHNGNWKDTIRNFFLAVAISQVHVIGYFFWFLNINKRFEQLFGIYRSKRGGNLNFDCPNLHYRLADSSLV